MSGFGHSHSFLTERIPVLQQTRTVYSLPRSHQYQARPPSAPPRTTYAGSSPSSTVGPVLLHHRPPVILPPYLSTTSMLTPTYPPQHQSSPSSHESPTSPTSTPGACSATAARPRRPPPPPARAPRAPRATLRARARTAGRACSGASGLWAALRASSRRRAGRSACLCRSMSELVGGRASEIVGSSSERWMGGFGLEGSGG